MFDLGTHRNFKDGYKKDEIDNNKYRNIPNRAHRFQLIRALCSTFELFVREALIIITRSNNRRRVIDLRKI